ncbi:hypothetical protein [Janthinobacterium lividum]|uniref:hypothetical protein n=1 Tax=Janthinobacterium sp. LB2P10 TaxID=3424194 RepID=UPI00115559F6
MRPHLHAVIFVLSQAILLSPRALHAQQTSVIVEALPEHLQYLYSRPVPSNASVRKSDQVMVPGARQWENGRTLRVCLFSGNQTVATLIAEVAGEWNQYSGVKFDFGKERGWYNCLSPASGHFQIRIGFSERGYWSTMGRDSEMLMDALAPSMNLEHFNLKYTESKFAQGQVVAQADAYDKAVIRHEFGHALGLVHELQNPNLRCADEIKWEGPNNVFDYFAGPPNYWQRDKVKFNLDVDSQAENIVGEGDKDSNLKYWLPAQVFKKGENSPCYSNVNYEISRLDKKGVAIMYPPNTGTAPTGELNIAGATIKAMPKSASAPTRDDALSRAKVDLESSDVFIRRDARARLADLMPAASSSEINGLIEDMRGSSYRYKLGVAVALANQRSKLALSSGARERLSQELTAAKDITLKNNLRAASRL